MKYRLRVSNSFERDLRKLGNLHKEKTWKLIEQIQASPYSYKRLTGQLMGTRSARSGDLRIIYAIDEHDKRVILLHVGQRERVYEHY